MRYLTSWRGLLLVAMLGLAPALQACAPSFQPASSAVPISDQTIRDCTDCPALVVVPAGSFVMGSPPSEDFRRDDEGPLHRVTIPHPFAIGKFEVTVGEFKKFAQSTGYHAHRECRWDDPGFVQTELDPVVCVGWADAEAYVSWLSRRTGKSYRLPSEAEWEYASRAGTTTPYYWGNDTQALCGYANSDGSTCDDGQDYTSPVGSYRPNRFGLYDMLGNAWEWVQDCYTPDYRSTPNDGSAAEGNCDQHVLRGGAWALNPWVSRSANRSWMSIDERGTATGFRVVRVE